MQRPARSRPPVQLGPCALRNTPALNGHERKLSSRLTTRFLWLLIFFSSGGFYPVLTAMNCGFMRRAAELLPFPISHGVLFAVTALVAVNSGAAEQGAIFGPRPQLHTPDAIAPAVLPYLACLYAE